MLDLECLPRLGGLSVASDGECVGSGISVSLGVSSKNVVKLSG